MSYNKGLKPAFLVYLIIAVIGSFTISLVESVCFDSPCRDDSLSSNNYLSSIIHTIDWVAENITTIGKVHRFSSSQSRNVFARLFLLLGSFIGVIYPEKILCKIIKTDNNTGIKKQILLKLRI